MIDDLIRVAYPRPHARVRLYCLPHAGGAASFYREWGDRIYDDIEVAVVQYPGREDRIAHPPAESLQYLAASIATSIRRIGSPAALFGHSMGSAVGYLVAQELGDDIQTLFVSACPAPSWPRLTQHHLLDDDGLAEQLRRHAGTSPEVLADPALRELVVGIIRNDYRLIETHEGMPATPLSIPVTGFWAREDDGVPEAAMLDWADVTTHSFNLVPFDGGHFYLVEQRQRLLDAIARRLLGDC